MANDTEPQAMQVDFVSRNFLIIPLLTLLFCPVFIGVVQKRLKICLMNFSRFL